MSNDNQEILTYETLSLEESEKIRPSIRKVQDLYLYPDVKRKWLAALRSGDYKQAHGVLKSLYDNKQPKGYCCLGVLCEVVDPNGWDNIDGASFQSHGGEGSFLPYQMYDKIGISTENVTGDFKLKRAVKDSYGELHFGLVSLNDYGFTFEQIADIIEDQF